MTMEKNVENKKNFHVNFNISLADSVDILADNKEQALQIVMDMYLNDMLDCELWADNSTAYEIS